ncbi:hypothetical protein ACWGH2_28840 [Streptomyces sp. NPDC054871]
MLATPERVRETDGRTIQIWHLPADGQDCDGQCDWHAIACSDKEGIVMPGGTRDVPENLNESGQRWCPDCLMAMRAARAVAK